MHQTEKHLKTFLKKKNCYDFLKYRIFRKLTTDFENRTKHQAETKSCIVLDVGHTLQLGQRGKYYEADDWSKKWAQEMQKI